MSRMIRGRDPRSDDRSLLPKMNGASHDDIDRALLELEQLGLVERTGELRNGQPVWVATALCKRLEEAAPEQMKSIFN